MCRDGPENGETHVGEDKEAETSAKGVEDDGVDRDGLEDAVGHHGLLSEVPLPSDESDREDSEEDEALSEEAWSAS